MGRDEVDVLWRQLDPVFVRGMQRSGTSVMARALQQMGIRGFGEGHLWFEIVEAFQKLRDPSYFPSYRDDAYALGEDRERQLEKYVAVCLDQFHRDHLPSGLSRWMDKSPGANPVRVAPMLAELFPRCQFIFLHRNGIMTVHSGSRFWVGDSRAFELMCKGWTETMSAWRNVRGALEGRYIEIAQEDIAAKPFSIAKRLTDFLDQPEAHVSVGAVFKTKRALSAFPDKEPGDYHYQIDWTPEQRAEFIDICGKEMEIWDYELNFDSPGVSLADLAALEKPDATMEVLGQREARISELEQECHALREHLKLVQQGRVMRFLNWMQSWRSS